MEVVLNTDGGLLSVKGLPKPLVVWGFSISHPNGAVLHEESLVTAQQGTNNEAEYLAVIHGLAACVRLGVTSVLLRVDSQMVARQLEGAYQVKAANLKSYYKNAKRLSTSIKVFRVEWVPRENNRRADDLCHQAMHLWRHQNGIEFKGKNSSKAKARKAARKRARKRAMK